jgi:hypothetical protein
VQLQCSKEEVTPFDFEAAEQVTAELKGNVQDSQSAPRCRPASHCGPSRPGVDYPACPTRKGRGTRQGRGFRAGGTPLRWLRERGDSAGFLQQRLS